MGARILSISYDERLLLTRQLLLESRGFCVTSIQRLSDAVRISCAKPFDLVVVGHPIPQKDAERIIAKLKTVHDTAVLALLRPHDAPLAIAEHNLDSCDPGAFLELVEALLGERSRSFRHRERSDSVDSDRSGCLLKERDTRVPCFVRDYQDSHRISANWPLISTLNVVRWDCRRVCPFHQMPFPG